MTEPVTVFECTTLVELAIVRAILEHAETPFAVDEREEGEETFYTVRVAPEHVDRARMLFHTRGLDEDEAEQPEMPAQVSTKGGTSAVWGRLRRVFRRRST